MKHDNRWSPGSSGATVPEGAPAAYSARWIDKGHTTPADIVPDRQGFAYDDVADRDTLMALMAAEGPCLRTPSWMDLPYDDATDVATREGYAIAYRRAGGYIYVDAWLVDPEFPDFEEDVMVTRTFTVIVRHDPSWFADEGALLSALTRAITSKNEWVPVLPTVTEVEVHEAGTSVPH